jgi:transcriptional regulator with XRE-family HTH domain
METVKTLIWTKPGLIKLGEIIRRGREAKNLNLRDAACFVSTVSGVNVAHNTFGTIERATAEPKYNTLAAIAASGIVELDGRKLDIFDFIAIASGTALSAIASEADSKKEEVNMDALARLISEHLFQNRLTLEEFAVQSGVSLSDLEEIMRGSNPSQNAYDQETNLILIAGYIINPTTGRTFHSYLELVEYCGMRQDSTGAWQQDHQATTGKGSCECLNYKLT